MVERAHAMTIDGSAHSGLTWFDVVNPATGTVFAQAPDCTAAELDSAVNAARTAFPAWSARAPAERRALVAAMGQSIFGHIDELKRLLTREQGKPLAESAMELMAAGYWCQAMAAMEIPPQVLDDGAERRIEIRRVPVGVVAAIAPWNFPVALAFFKVAPALVAGNTMVLKPSPLTPLTTLRLGEMFRAILPPGVLNIVSGGDALGPMLTAHLGVDKISFTGSTETGRKVMRSAADTLKRVTLELGGNDPAIVLPSFDVERMAAELFWAAFRNNGQLCIAAKRIYIPDSLYASVAAALTRLAKNARVGPGDEEGVELGPLQNRQQYERVIELMNDARARGASFLSGGSVPSGAGYFLPPTLVDNPPDDARVVTEEQFGPVLPLLRYTTVDEAIERANASSHGLGASVWGEDTAHAQSVAERMIAGTVWVNEAHYLSPSMPFAGRKQSGIGVENGLEGLLEYTAIQTVVIRKRVAEGTP